MRVVIRADANDRIGSGHLMRCLTLADALAERGAEVVFACLPLAEPLVRRLAAHGHSWHCLADASPAVMADFLAAQAADWLIVDHYGCDAAWERVQRLQVRRILVIDDLADRDHDCDLLLDQNWHPAPAERYRNRVAAGTRLLLGPDYALLSSEFSRLRGALLPLRPVQQVLLSFGGSDPSGETLKLLPGLAREFPAWQWQVVVGGLNPQLAAIGQCAAGFPNVQLQVDVTTMAQLMQQCDLFIGAGGATTWERACLGLPSVVAAVSDNQEALSAEFAALGAQIYLGRAATLQLADWCAALQALAGDVEARQRLRRQSLAAVDGQGAARVAACLLQGEGA